MFHYSSMLRSSTRILRPQAVLAARNCPKPSFSASFQARHKAVVTYFSDPASVPEPYQSPEAPKAQAAPQEPPVRETSRSSYKDITIFIAMMTLAYFAVDNYFTRIKVEKLSQEATAINAKTFQLSQQNQARIQKAHNIALLNERAAVTKRNFKMAMHIAMLKKQLLDLGVTPKEIADVAREFEEHARVNNSVQNLTGSAIWLDNDSSIRGLMPDYRDYDRKRGQ